MASTLDNNSSHLNVSGGGESSNVLIVPPLRGRIQVDVVGADL